MRYVVYDKDGVPVRYGVNTNGAPQAQGDETERALEDEEAFPILSDD